MFEKGVAEEDEKEQIGSNLKAIKCHLLSLLDKFAVIHRDITK